MQGFRIVGALYAKIPYYVVLYMQTKQRRGGSRTSKPPWYMTWSGGIHGLDQALALALFRRVFVGKCGFGTCWACSLIMLSQLSDEIIRYTPRRGVTSGRQG